MRVLVANAGSSSIKLRLVDGARDAVASRDVEAEDGGDVEATVSEVVRSWEAPDAVGHRVVHGGREHRSAVLLDDDVVASLERLTPLAPLHQPRSLHGIEVMQRVLPDVPHVACFDTSFFIDLPDAARTYPLPAEWRERYGLVRYGFHGLSHSYSARTVGSIVGADRAARVVTCHLGAGASLAAVRDGRPVDTTMGFTPLEGVVMATRSGSVDPGMLLWLQTHAGLDAAEVADGLEHRSGLHGLAGTADMRAVIESASSGDANARAALDVYIHRLRAGIAAMVAAAGGLDALVFTGGIGENASEVRRETCNGLAFLGVRIDEGANQSLSGDGTFEAADSSVAVAVIAAREELEIAAQVEGLLSTAET